MRARSLAPVLLLTFLPATALGHALVTNPPARNPDPNQKTNPCMPAVAGAVRTTLIAGQTIDVTYNETIDHVGYFHIDVDLAGDTFNAAMPTTVVLTNPTIDDPLGDAVPRTIVTQVTLPSTPCETCTLRVIQCMNAADPTPVAACAADSYFSCADIRIVAADGDAGPVPDGGIGPDGGPGSPDGGAGIDDGIGEAPGLGCAVGGGGLAWPALGLAGLALALLRRRRR